MLCVLWQPAVLRYIRIDQVESDWLKLGSLGQTGKGENHGKSSPGNA